jgi:protein-disulfide isomerase
VTVVLFSDFQCTACRGFEPALQDMLKKYGSQVRLVYRSFTFGLPIAAEAARAALCAGDQQRFWDLHDQILRSGRPDLEFLNMNAAAIRLNMEEFGACLGSGHYADAVRRDTYEAAALGVTSTPALFVNGRPLLAPRSVDEVAQLIDDELFHISRAATKSRDSQAKPAFPDPEARR